MNGLGASLPEVQAMVEGAKAFADSWRELLETIKSESARLAA